MFKFITSRPLWVNILAAIVFALLIFFIFLQLLGLITKHGQYLIVPSVVGRNTIEAIKFLEDKGFDVVIQDSIYVDTAKRGIVLKQLPDPNSTVKVNRSVFLTVNRVTLPMIDMPALEGKTLNYALVILEHGHLKLGDTIYKPDFMRGSVLEQLYNGNKIAAGSKIPWGSRIDLVLAGGLNSDRFIVPSVLGLTLREAKTLLEAEGINVGAIVVDPGTKDTLAGFIYKQNPPKYTEDKQPNYIQSGQLMDLYVSPFMKSSDSTIVQ